MKTVLSKAQQAGLFRLPQRPVVDGVTGLIHARVLELVGFHPLPLLQGNDVELDPRTVIS